MPAHLLVDKHYDIADHPQPLLQEARGAVPQGPEDPQVQVQHAVAYFGEAEVRQVSHIADGGLLKGSHFHRRDVHLQVGLGSHDLVIEVRASCFPITDQRQ